MGLITPNISLKFDHSKSNTHIISRVEPTLTYNPYVSVLNDYHSSGLYMGSIQQPVSQNYLLNNSKSVVNDLRVGDSKLTQAAWLLILIWMLQQQGVGFKPIKRPPMLPHIESARNLLFGKSKSNPYSSRQSSIFDSKQYENQDKCVMSRD